MLKKKAYNLKKNKFEDLHRSFMFYVGKNLNKRGHKQKKQMHGVHI